MKNKIMGDIAEMILDGILDEQTGEYIGDGVGYPRTMQKGFYNSVKKQKPKQNNKNYTNLGGLYLIGEKVEIEKYGDCIIKNFVGRRGRKRYVVVDNNDNEYKVKFSSMKLIEI